jgi:hypothetical protein
VEVFPARLRVFTATLVGIAAIVALVVGRATPPPQALPLILFVVLEIFSDHREVRFSPGIVFSPGIMVSMASVVVFVDSGALLGAMIVGMAAGCRLYWRRRGYRGWIAFNAANIGLATLLAALIYSGLPPVMRSSIPLVIVSGVLCTFASSIAHWTVIGLSFVAERSAPSLREFVARILPNTLQSLPFAVLGFLLGQLYIALGPAVLLLIIVPILIAREMFASYMRVKESHEETVGMLIRALEQKDHYTAGHAERVATYARYMGEELNFMPARLERLRFAALMHDIGKLVVPNHILNKPGRLTPEEFARVRLHEKVGVQMLAHIDFLRPIAPTTHGDAMHFDPDDPDHPIEPYIVMIADAYDAMTSTRAYRKALPQDVAFRELRDKAGVQFHPQCVEALIGSIERRGERHGAGFEEQTDFDNAPVGELGSAGLGDLLPTEAG